MDTYVIDTNIFIQHPWILKELDRGNEIVIPQIVVTEITNLKSREGETGYNAREAGRALEDLLNAGDVIEGIEYGGNKVFIRKSKEDYDCFDDRILSVAIEVNKPEGEVILLTNDIDLILKGRMNHITTRRFKDAPNKKIKYLTDGIITLTVPSSIVATAYDLKYVNIGLLDEEKAKRLYPNLIVVLEDESNEKYKAITRVHGSILELVNLEKKPSGVQPRNLEQKIAIAHLLDDEIPLVTLTGVPGSSKTFLALASALELLNLGRYKRILIAKPPVALSRDYEVGFLPGGLLDKYMSVLGSITTNLVNMRSKDSEITGRQELEGMVDQGMIEVLSIEDIMGSSYKNSIIILDEGQLLDKEAMKAVITRVGEGSKIIITGDLRQYGKNKLSPENSGLFHLVNSLKNSVYTAHLTMKKVYRSELVSDIIRHW